MWTPPPPQTRCKQAERERDLALEANRLFKQDFGDKIESLQVEAEQLRKHRYILSGREWHNELWSLADCVVGHVSPCQVLSGARAEERARAEDDIQASRHPSEGAQTPREHPEGTATLKEALILVSLLCHTKSVFWINSVLQNLHQSKGRTVN